MRIIAHQFVLGRTIEETVARDRQLYRGDYVYSFDMLGEAAMTREYAQCHYEAYLEAIRFLGRTGRQSGEETRSFLA
jgi:RHH-type proline utilization regulon transcriptional repressor/proline dehydrogenase/delta 1-pyrroline-5-carboxylate dehydrogenase